MIMIIHSRIYLLIYEEKYISSQKYVNVLVSPTFHYPYDICGEEGGRNMLYANC